MSFDIDSSTYNLDLYSHSAFSSPYYRAIPKDYLIVKMEELTNRINSDAISISDLSPDTFEFKDILGSLKRADELNPYYLYDSLIENELLSEDLDKVSLVEDIDRILARYTSYDVAEVETIELSSLKDYALADDYLKPYFDHDSIDPGVYYLIRQRREKIYKLVKNHMLSERHAENKDLDVFINLIAYILGELKQRSLMIPELKDPLETPEKFLKLLGREKGYDIPEDVRPRNARLLIQNWHNINRRRGTNSSIVNLARYAGREKYSFLEIEEGINVGVQELIGQGLVRVDLGVMEDTDVDYIVDTIQYRVPAGVKLTYAVFSNIPGVATEETVDLSFFSRLVKSKDINIDIDETSQVTLLMDEVFDELSPVVDDYGELTGMSFPSNDIYRIEKNNTFTNTMFSNSRPSNINPRDKFREESNLVKIS